MIWTYRIFPHVWSARLHWARFRAICLIWFDTIFNDLQQNVVFSGVIIIAYNTMVSWNIEYFEFIVIVSSIILIPLLKISVLTNKKDRLFLYYKQFSKYRNLGFEYFLYHADWTANFSLKNFTTIRFINKKIDAVERNYNAGMYKKLNNYENDIRHLHERILFNLHDVDTRPDSVEFYRLHGFRSFNALYHFLRFHLNQMKAELSVYIDRSIRVINAKRNQGISDIQLEKLITQRKQFRARFEERKKDLSILENVALVKSAKHIATQRSTTNSVVQLRRALQRITQDSLYRTLSERSETWSILEKLAPGLTDWIAAKLKARTIKKCTDLVELVRYARGTDLVLLAGIGHWYGLSKHEDIPSADDLWSKGRGESAFDPRLAENVIFLLTELHTLHGQQTTEPFDFNDRQINFATSGHSETIIGVLSGMRDKARQVYVLQADPGMEEENSSFRAALLVNELQDCRMVSAQTLKQVHFRTRIDCLLIGFEMVDRAGHMLHPRGVSDAIEQALLPGFNGHKPVAIAVGTSGKMHEFDESSTDPELVSVYSPNFIDAIVTEKAIYLKDDTETFDLIERPFWLNIKDVD